MVSTMFRFPLQVLVLVLLLVYKSNGLNREPKIRCIEDERKALLKVKESLRELKHGFLSSWSDEEKSRDCCEWHGILCSKQSGHVTSLDLSPTYSPSNRIYRSIGEYSNYYEVLNDDSRFLRGNISTSLLELKHLTYLDLSVISFEGNGIPSFIGKLSKLRYLNLSYTSVIGEIPSHLGNLSSLQVLDLGRNYGLTSKSIDWVSRISSLTLLDLTYTNMSEARDWIQEVNKISYLKSLKLSQCDLPSVVPSSLSLINSSKSLTVLDLSQNKLSDSVFELVFTFFRSLVHLNLDHTMSNSFIPYAFGNMTSLSHLSLGWNSLKGPIPETLWNLSSLVYLNLGGNRLEGFIPESIGNLKSLSYLNLGGNRLEGFIPESIGNLKSLSFLSLGSNKLKGSIPYSLGNLTELEHVSLRANELEGSVPESLGNLTSLVHLSLGLNKLQGSIPKAFGNFSSLEHLDLSYNNLEGEIPNSIWNLCSLRMLRAERNNLRSLQLPELTQSSPRCENYSLQHLSLGQNKLEGTVPEVIGQFSQLKYLDLSDNSFNGVITEAHFSKLSKLSTLYLSSNSLALNFSHDWIPPFKLGIIGLHSCNVGPKFPKWLQTQKGYSVLGLSNAGISDSIPDWFWDISTDNCFSMDLSDNDIHGTISNPSFEFNDYPRVKLSSNKLEGPIPRFLFKVGALDLSRNRFSNLNSLCNVGNDSPLSFLDLSFNHLSGYLPDCWSPFKELRALVLGKNKLSGKIPSSIGSLTDIGTLNLANNYFTRGLPSSIRKCRKLTAINVGGNRLYGTIPTWVGESLSNLVILSLRSNHFFGEIPSQLCHLSNLQLLDLSSNGISGKVPECVNNFTAVKKSWEGVVTSIYHTYSYSTSSGNSASYTSYDDKVELVWKGTLSKFGRTLGLVKYFDLSSNELMGQIPTGITELVQMVFLNLSRNNLSGQIPMEIGKLSLLDTLDLSNNQLSGAIPISLSQVDRLNTLDLSNNNLSGKIPTSTQLQSFKSTSYEGNPQLCGTPLPKKCVRAQVSQENHDDNDDDDDDDDVFMSQGFYFSMGMGFVVGFWGVCGTLIFNKTWRYTYLNFWTDAKDWIYVMVLVYKAKLLRKMFKDKQT